MLRINLLPSYIYEGKKKRNVGIYWALGIASCIGLYAYGNAEANRKLDEQQTKLTEAETLRKQYEASEAKITETKTQVAVIKTKQDFVASAKTWNGSFSKLYTDMRDYVSPRIVLQRMNMGDGTTGGTTGGAAGAVNPSTVNMGFFASNEDDAARWHMNLLKFAGTGGRFKTVTVEYPNLHAYSGTGQANVPGGAGMGGAGFGGGKSTPGLGTSGSGGGGRPAGAGGFGGGGNAQTASGTTVIEGRSGLQMVAHLELNQPFAGTVTSAPVWPPSGSGSTTGGTTGGFSGGGGGYSPPGGAAGGYSPPRGGGGKAGGGSTGD